MKKTVKFISFITVILLIFSAVTVGAFSIAQTDALADYYEKQLKPNGATNQFAYTNADGVLGQSNALKNITSNQAVTVNGNTFLSMHNTNPATGTAASDGYRNLGMGGTASVPTSNALVDNNTVKYQAFVFDFDLMPDRYRVKNNDGSFYTCTYEELISKGLTPESENVDISYISGDRFFINGYYATDSTASTAFAASPIYLVENSGTWYYANNKDLDSATYKVKVSGVGIFDHVTMIIYPELVYSGSEVTCTQIKSVTYINGELAYKATNVDSGKKAISFNCCEFRLTVSMNYLKQDYYSYGIDNYTANYYEPSAEQGGIGELLSSGNLDNYAIFDCTDAVGSYNYISPSGYFQVQNPSGNREIVSFLYVVEQEMESIEDGATVLTTMDIDSLKLPEDVNNVNIKCDNQKVKVTLSDELTKRGLEITKTNDGYSVALSDNIPEGVAVIEWKTHDGKILKTTTHSVGDSVDVPSECVPYETAHDWYVERYSWANVASAAQGKTVVKANKEYVGKIQGILQNATLFTDMTYNLYLPVSDEVSGVSVEGAILAENITVGEGKYYRISATPEVNDFAPIDATVKFKVGDIPLEYDVTLDIVKYASKVSEKYECGSDEATLVYELLAFKSAVALYLDNNFEPNASYSNYLDSHKDCECTSSGKDFKSSELSVDYEDLKKQGVTAIAYELNVSTMDFIIYVNDGVVIDSVSYTDPLGTVITHTESAENLEKIGNYYLVKNISAAYIANVMTIKVGNVSGTYSLAKYIQDSTNDAGKNVANALYTYSKAAFEYKNITVSEHKFSVSFDTDGGSEISSILVQGGKTVPLPEAPEKLGHKFAYWSYENEEYNFNTPVSSNLTLKAVWERASDEEMYDKMQSVLLIGQSNMVGQADLSTVDPISDERLFMLREDKWIKMQEPIHTSSMVAGIGLSASFGKAFVETFDTNLGLIPAAKGGTNLTQWAVGGELYNEAVRLAKIAQESSEICAILWHQGESNENDTAYAEKLKVILDSIIEELGLDENKIVIITGELFGTRSDEVHMGQLIELGQYYKNYGIALSDGLTVQDINTHFDGPSLRVFGYRYFSEFYKIVTDRTYQYDDDPKNYLSPQTPIDENTYLPFDDMVTGKAYDTDYCGTGKLDVSSDIYGSVTINEGEGGNKYLSISNGCDSSTGKYTTTFVDGILKKTEEAGTTVAIEAKFKLGEGSNCNAYLFRVIGNANGSSAYYNNLYVRVDGTLGIVKADGTITDLNYKLGTNEWVTIKVILDMSNNKKNIYINGNCVGETLEISTSNDTSEYVITHTRIVVFAPKGDNTIGNVLVDDYRFYPVNK